MKAVLSIVGAIFLVFNWFFGFVFFYWAARLQEAMPVSEYLKGINVVFIVISAYFYFVGAALGSLFMGLGTIYGRVFHIVNLSEENNGRVRNLQINLGFIKQKQPQTEQEPLRSSPL